MYRTMILPAVNAWAMSQVERARKQDTFTTTLDICVNPYRILIDDTAYAFEDYGFSKLSDEGGQALNIIQLARLGTRFAISGILNEAGIPHKITWEFGRRGQDYSVTFTVKIGEAL